MKICAVIVTYGDRFHFLKQVIKACFKEGVNKIIVIDNASEEKSKKQLKEYERKESRLKVIYLDENTGSAGGYKRGLQEAYECNECEYILALDDDNIISKDFIKLLKKYYMKIVNEKGIKNFGLVAYRDYDYLNNFIKGIDKVTDKRYYRGFNIVNVVKKRMKFKRTKESIFKIRKIPVAPYGGMFFPKFILSSVGFPNEKLYLYADDFEFSYRISQQYNLFLISSLKIEDIDSSWKCDYKNKKWIYHPFINEGNEIKTYYLFRNSHYFEEKIMKKSGILYQLNKIIYIWCLLSIGILNLKFKRIKTILKAINDAKEL